MKTILATILMLIAVTANAHGYYHGYRGHQRGYYNAPAYNWVAPAIVSGIIGYGIARSQAPIIVQPNVIAAPHATAELPLAPYGFQWAQILDAGCNCYRTVLIQN
jgi:hypothetical protein